MTAIRGNTYPARRELRAMGGEWDGARKAWMVPDDRADEARALVGGGGSRRDSGRVPSTNRRGRCEDAPCCGCCS